MRCDLRWRERMSQIPHFPWRNLNHCYKGQLKRNTFAGNSLVCQDSWSIVLKASSVRRHLEMHLAAPIPVQLKCTRRAVWRRAVPRGPALSKFTVVSAPRNTLMWRHYTDEESHSDEAKEPQEASYSGLTSRWNSRLEYAHDLTPHTSNRRIKEVLSQGTSAEVPWRTRNLAWICVNKLKLASLSLLIELITLT